MPGGFAAQGDFGAIHLKHSWIATGGAPACGDAGSGQEPKLHQAARIVSGKINPVEDSDLAPTKIQETALATQLHLELVCARRRRLVNTTAVLKYWIAVARSNDSTCFRIKNTKCPAIF